ncbi:MAG: diguanylate cyclase [Burkholderiales bacterium]|nr:diguanylate cyclase [Burkholderiales bacterium]MDE2432961.1 diguanylate cyclase [Burkholderiales bacterium]HET8695009.1 diguanylate cyclase [Aquabacterium sp.]
MRKSQIHTPPVKPPTSTQAAAKTAQAAKPAAPAAPAVTPNTPAAFAKAALRRMAEQRQEPTPENYRKAYEAESGQMAPATTPTAESPEGPATAPAVNDGERWSTLITRVMKGAERGGRQWTAARKKDSLQRVLQSSRSSGELLHQRLSQLVNSWDSDTLDPSLMDAVPESAETATAGSIAGAASETAPVASSPAAVLPQAAHEVRPEQWPDIATHALNQLHATIAVALPAQNIQAAEASLELSRALQHSQEVPLPMTRYEVVRGEVTDACHQVRRIIEHRHHLLDQLTDLCHSLTDSLVDLAEEDSWVQGQCASMRHQLNDGLNSRGVRHVQQLLADTRERQHALKLERAAARTALKQLIHQMLQEIAELGSTTDRFQSNLTRYADTIGAADSLESLTGVVREMVEESRAVQAVVSQTQDRLNTEHSRATELTEKVKQLEDEIRRLSDEVSTDPLTQIANRRGMMRAFDTEKARMDRTGGILSIALLDVDNFKKLNDQMGHQTGDEALKFLARRVGELLRPGDVVARYGGEEFVVMLPETNVEDGQQVLTRLQRTLSAEFFTHEDKKVFITFSAGVTTYRADEPIEAALERADIALYEAKRTGKNRTCMA